MWLKRRGAGDQLRAPGAWPATTRRIHRSRLHQRGHPPAPPAHPGSAEGPAKGRPGLHPAGRHPGQVRPGRRLTRRLLPQAPLARGERAGGHRSGRPAAVAVTRAAAPGSRPDRCPHPPHHPHLRAPGRPDPGRPRLPGRRPLTAHRHPTIPAGTQPHREDRQPGPGPTDWINTRREPSRRLPSTLLGVPPNGGLLV